MNEQKIRERTPKLPKKNRKKKRNLTTVENPKMGAEQKRKRNKYGDD